MENQNWKPGKNGSSVVSDVKPNRPTYSEHDFESEKEYYGGYIIAESIPDKQMDDLIAGAPKMLQDRINDRKAFAEILELMPETDEYDPGDILMQIESIARGRLFHVNKATE
ncbi:MAG TPA: hypothetical protein DHV48_03470 [Prolixibacteraceae bacterium]|nr:hypothetical protein [Prolixibacteraceae bacterium]